MQVNSRSNLVNTKPSGPKPEEDADPIEAVTDKIEIADQLSIANEAGVFVARVGAQVPKLENLGKVAALVEREAAVVAKLTDAGDKTGKVPGAVGKGFERSPRWHRSSVSSRPVPTLSNCHARKTRTRKRR
ncbi:hypothetical protein D3C72_612510 [compost metagenome]